MNLYACTNVNGFTAGTANRELKTFERSPLYYEYADSEEQAIQQRTEFHHDKAAKFEAVLIKTNVLLPIHKAEEVSRVSAAAVGSSVVSDHDAGGVVA